MKNITYLAITVTVTVLLLGSLAGDFYDYKPWTEDSIYWFQRVGSIAVVFGALMEFQLEKAQEKGSSKKVFMEGKQVQTGRQLTRAEKFYQVSARVFIVCGTLIWGYGDIPFQ